jgi:hypothetical protein
MPDPVAAENFDFFMGWRDAPDAGSQDRNLADLRFDSRDPAAVEPSMLGRFENGLGVFHTDHVHEGRPIRVRFLWSRPTADTCRWEQAFSADAGLTWETNWTMDFSRA